MNQNDLDEEENEIKEEDIDEEEDWNEDEQEKMIRLHREWEEFQYLADYKAR